MWATPGSSVLSPSSCSWGIHTGQGLGSLAAWASRSPKHLTGHSSSSWRGTPLFTYATLVPRRNEALRLSATLPASLPAFCFIPWSWCRLHRTWFYTSWSLHHSPVTSRPSFGLITHDIQSILPFLWRIGETYVTWGIFNHTFTNAFMWILHVASISKWHWLLQCNCVI